MATLWQCDACIGTGSVPPPTVARRRGPLLPKLRGQFAEFLQHRSLKRLGMLYQSTSVGFGYGLKRRRCFPEAVRSRPNPIRDDTLSTSSRPGWLGNINPIPIGYGLRPRLRGPANPARINLAQEPLDFRREGFSPSLTLLMSAFSLPIPPACLTAHLHRPTERSATACPGRTFGTPAASVRGLSPVTFSARDNLIRPVSYYAFFKGWLLLSQPPGCLGRPTSFPT